MPQDDYQLIFRPGTHPSEISNVPHGYQISREDGMLIERDVGVPMRDGIKIYIDLFRPDDASRTAKIPAVIAWGLYGKDNPRGTYERFPDFAGVKREWLSKYTCFEAPDPLDWTRHGYAIINVDPRGMWHSEGNATFWSAEEARDFYDLIEWTAAQAWCNGKVGATGVSYFATAQWQVATLNPPHLAAINPWEGYSDSYRERLFHAGIPENAFFARWMDGRKYSLGQVEDVAKLRDAHPFFDSYWKSKAPDLSRITVPAYVVASWSDQGLHTRGTLEGFKQISSAQKWLEVHGRKKWQYYMQPESVAKQRAFFDHFLKGTSDEVLKWPKVNIEVRERAYVGPMRAETEWPLARTQYTKLFLDARGHLMDTTPPQAPAEARYPALTGSVRFHHRFATDTELTGHMKLKLWVATSEGDDMDLFVAVQKLDAKGEQVTFTYFSIFVDGPVAMGWLRVSHRELDPKRSTAYQPWLLHRREQRLKPGEIVPVELEILASSTLFRAGESLRLLIQGSDIYEANRNQLTMGHGPLRNAGEHIIHTGGNYDAHLLVPVIPPKK
jgi:predicted acyl esterase